MTYLRGQGHYVDDVGVDGELHMAILRSPYARARIKQIDCRDAVRKSCLILLPRDNDLIMRGAAMNATFDHKGRSNIVRWPVLPADGMVNFEGQPVAAVVGTSIYEAYDLLDLISVDYEPLPSVLTIKESMEGGEIIHGELPDNVSVDVTYSGGDVNRAFSEADYVFEDELYMHRTIPNPIETRGVVAYWQDGKVNLWVSNQGPFRLRDQLASVLGLPKDSIRVDYVDVGGAFGTKTTIYPEYVLACYASLILKRPVKWVESRSEHMRGTIHAREVMAKLAFATAKDGRVRGIKGTVIADIGAYNFFINANYAPFIAQQLTGPYDVPAGEVRALAVFTNKTPLGPLRGAGRPEAAFFYERMMDLVARELGLDPVEVRMRNLVRLESMPYSNPFGLTLDREDYTSMLKEAVMRFEYQKLRSQVQEARREGRLVGLGVSNYVELNRTIFGEGAKVTLTSDGGFLVTFGSSPHGQYHSTVFRQLLADYLDVDISRVVAVPPKSDLIPEGVGSFGSRSAVIGGEAVLRAAMKLKGELLRKAGSMLNKKAEQLDLRDGWVVAKDSQERLLPLEQLARDGELSCYEFAKGQDIFSYGVHMALVELDRETCKLRSVKYFAIDDAGRVLNPLISEGQIIGGIVIGLSYVFYEKASYDNGVLKAGGITEAGVAASDDVPLDVVSELYEFPSTYTHNARGIGEAGTIGSIQCLVSAVEDAIGMRIRSTSISPEVLWERWRCEKQLI
ncbi:MAG: xanthine dehydrogenase family protein molybdopterin-binding subunit [Candidatus Caldarchaeum sp.]